MKRNRKIFSPVFLPVYFFALAILAGAALLHSPPARAEQGVFWLDGFSHAVSAFCNAGFALYPGSMTRYADNFSVNITLMTLIICGGLGFYVLVGLPGFFAALASKEKRSEHDRGCGYFASAGPGEIHREIGVPMSALLSATCPPWNADIFSA